MRICLISKYPPIEGGVSSRNYWMAKALGKKGHEVFVVTDAWEIEETWREQIGQDELDKLMPENVQVFSTGAKKSPFFIPRYNARIAKLSSLALSVNKKYDVDIIFSHYLMPYGVVGLMMKGITNKPFLVRHAGSDITRLYDYPFFQPIFNEIFKNADKIVEYSNTRRILESKGLYLDKYVHFLQVLDTEAFNPCIDSYDLSKVTEADTDVTIFSYFGKISSMKKTREFVNALSNVKKEFLVLFVVGEGFGVEDLKKQISSTGLKQNAIFLPFQPPWKIPSLMRASSCVVIPESREEPYLPAGTHGPAVVREAMACGSCTIVGEGLQEKNMIENGVNTLAVNPDNTKEFSEKLAWVIENRKEAEKIGKTARRFIEETENYEEKIGQDIRILEGML